MIYTNTMTTKEVRQIREIVRRALVEDVGDGDITTNATVSKGTRYEGIFLAKANGVISGLEVAKLTFETVGGRIKFTPYYHDGAKVSSSQVLAKIEGPARTILTGERVALNFLQRMSGIATMTHKFVEAVGNNKAIILDTRKTVPGLRVLDRIAVRDGGGQNHRFGLFDMALVKDNHIVAAGSITQAVRSIRQSDKRHRAIEVEVKNMDELREAITVSPDRILLDNMDLEQIKEAVKITAKRVPLEVSGGVTLDTVSAIAATGVDYVSSGALTHSVKALDISLELTRQT